MCVKLTLRRMLCVIEKSLVRKLIMMLTPLLLISCGYNQQLYRDYKAKYRPEKLPKSQYSVFVQSSPSKSILNGVVEVVWEDAFMEYCETIGLFTFTDVRRNADVILQLSYGENVGFKPLHENYRSRWSVGYSISDSEGLIGSGWVSDEGETSGSDWSEVDKKVARNIMQDIIFRIVADLKRYEERKS